MVCSTSSPDRNMAVNKYVKDSHPDVINQNDVWHTTKAEEKEISQVARGPKYKHGVSWHEELSDKIASCRTHVTYIIKSSNGNPQFIRDGIDNIIAHYKNDHRQCLPQSRCRIDRNYLPSKVIITDQRAEHLL